MSQQKNNILQWLTAINPFQRNSTNPNVVKKDLRNFIAPVQLQRVAQDTKTWRDAIMEAENAWYPHRVKMQRIFIDTINNGHVYACMQRRRDLTLLRKIDFVDEKGETDDEVANIFTEQIKGARQNKEWFNRFLNAALDSIYFGYTLVTLGDIVNGGFPNLDIIKRWNVSPDRLNVTNFVYSISGAPFLEEPYLDWHVWIPTYNEVGSSKCGFGLLYKVALYEIFLRNLLGYNGDFVELFAQPFRVGKTTKTDESERGEFAQILQEMGSAGWALIDPEDDIQFIATTLGGTGFQGYDNLEQRLEKKISKLILGHADALDSVPGKLGGSQKNSPADDAMKDIQTKDGSWAESCINGILIPKLINLGFSIPPDVKATFKNDAETMETNNAIISQAVEMKKAGLQMDNEYFTQQTGIKVGVTTQTTTYEPATNN